MTFPLTSVGRRNLKAILGEFERANRSYRPLYHKLLVAWSEAGEVRLSNAQWQAFIDAKSSDPDDGEWWEWNGPHSASPAFSGTFLGRWYGDPAGLQEFVNLAESVTMVLNRENLKGGHDLELPFDFRSWNSWISTLHAWAIKFDMPLLSSDMALFGAEDSAPDDFFELSEQMRQSGDVSWPLHPVCWGLTYNVFTSSVAAIRAILRPETAISFNDPWPCLGRNSNPLPPDKGNFVPPPSCHRIVHDAIGWHVHFADSPHPLLCSHKSGLHMIAILIQSSGQEIEASQLCQYGERSQQHHRTVHGVEELDFGDLTVSKSPVSSQDKDNEDARHRTQLLLEELRRDREEARKDDDVADKLIIAEIEEKILKIKQTYNVDDNFVVKSQRPFRDEQEKKAYDSVSRNIRNAITGLKKGAPQCLIAIKELEDQIPLPRLVFEPKDRFTPWIVESRLGRRNQ